MHPDPTRFDPSDLAASPYPAVVIRNGVVVDVNRQAAAVLDDIWVGSEILDLVSEPDREAMSIHLLGEAEPAPPRRVTLLTPAGDQPVESSWFPITFGGEPATLMMWREASGSERVPAWLAALTDDSSDLIGVSDLRGNLLYMNDALLCLRGEDSDHGLPHGRNAIDQIAPGQSDIVENMLEALEVHGLWRGELMLHGVDRFVPVDAVVQRHDIADQALYSLVGRDISRELELRNQLQSAIETRVSFAAHVAHEIKNPLAGIVGMALVLRDESEPSPEQREMLELLIAGATDIERIVEDLAAMSSDVTSPPRIVPSQVDLRSTARTVIETLEAGHDVSVDLSGQAVCVGDEVRIRQVLRNLLTNAVRYGGQDVRVAITSNGVRARIEVSDDGEGVPPEYTEAIFEDFSSAHNSIEDSMGVGLAVSRQLTIGMGGTLCYARRDGRTRFTMDLPAAAATP